MEKRGQRLDPNDCIGYYCKQQIGSGSYFASDYHMQRGYGLFSNLRRYAMPIMIKAGKYLGKHLLSTGQNVLEDMVPQGKSFKEVSKYQLRAGLFVKDTAGKFDDVTLTNAGFNKGLRKRWDRVKYGKVFDMCGILHTDIGTQSKFLINGTSIRIRLIKAKNEFSLLAATGDYRLQIENKSIYVIKCEISSSILVAHEKALEQSLIQMPFTRIEVKTFTVSSGLESVIIPNGNVVLRKDIIDKNIVYFKIVNNSEIVQYINNEAQEERFGFCQLHRTDLNDKFKVFSPNKNLFVNLLDCVLEARDITSDEDRKKLKRGFMEEEEYPNVSPKKSVKKGKPQNIFDLDLSPPSSGSHEIKIPPYNVYLGKGAAIELKEFRKSYYIAFSKTVDGEIRNRFNLPLDQLNVLMKGKRYAFANNPFIPGFNKHEEESYIIAVDANHFYGDAMSQPLPIGHFFCLTKDEDFQDNEVIEPSSSHWATPIVLFEKKDVSIRFCANYCRLNDVTKKESSLLPRRDDTLDTLAGNTWISTLDLKSGFWQIRIHPVEKEKTTFATRQGLWQFKVRPFGFCNVPATFEHLMVKALGGLSYEDYLVNIDAIIIVGRSFEEHLKNIRRVL
ncbi:hypothetical protein TNCV_3296671 [Trichonephila clavipes]|uniref:Reverse transcriptase domain-containing protein n=1 Tax=Trichonephila clavipes TaxID=2585209 RepID=A0A8X6T974_TRICX|nr:hypothetical protein TNCV_3296671 [Trichonephila clavipes]